MPFPTLVTHAPALAPASLAALPPTRAVPSARVLILTFLAAFAISVFAKAPKAAGAIVKWKEIPAAVQTTIQTSVAGGKVENVQKIAINGVFIYCAEVKGTDGKWMKVYTTDAGALMKTEPDNARNKRKHKPLFG
jgi:hypothetical protein